MNKIYYSGNNAVDQVGQMNISGNIIPESWYKTIVSKAGKPNFHAINILADIVYWYRPVEVRDEESGVLKGYRKKFKEDLLQRSRKSIMNKFCLSSSQVDTALKCLVDIGVIFKELRTIEAGDKIFNNVLFIGINPDTLHDITFPKVDDNELDRDDCDFTDPISDSDRPYTEKYDTLSDFQIEGISKKQIPCSDESETYTKNTTKNTTKNSWENSPKTTTREHTENNEYTDICRNSDGGDGGSALRCDSIYLPDIDFDSMAFLMSDTRKRILNDLKTVIHETCSSDSGTFKISGENRDILQIKSAFRKLSREKIDGVIDYLTSNEIKVTNKKAYLIAVLFNAANSEKGIGAIYHDYGNKSRNKRSAFHNFEQRDYDFEELERRLVANSPDRLRDREYEAV